MHPSELGRSEANPLDRRDQRPPPNKFSLMVTEFPVTEVLYNMTFTSTTRATRDSGTAAAECCVAGVGLVSLEGTQGE
jgi:hypothetical protein